ncbi:hypothetical protein [Actinoallomurus rhizosphaericola]|uniref:hypothetical protein n=1 Tax=Actinoallomurus rhizosphaericola TaxID=2952536 RepID=UPI002091BC21|nr:hypothetical protein [Actinoallomurus rhizosphaericola]MCO5994203.1 hypothetical protein [Actinoallomurus rhizosphaericola]
MVLPRPREAPPVGGTKHNVILTPEGAELRERLLALLSEDSPLAPLSAEEQDALQRLIARALIR